MVTSIDMRCQELGYELFVKWCPEEEDNRKGVSWDEMQADLGRYYVIEENGKVIYKNKNYKMVKIWLEEKYYLKFGKNHK